MKIIMIKKLVLFKIIIACVAFYGIIYFCLHSVSFYRLNIQLQNVDENNKLVLDVYMETRCPDTQNFIDDQLVPVTKLLGNFITVNLYPYGKAEEKFLNGKWEFTCQHGPEECQGNTILACVISITNQSVYVPFSSCLMKDLNPLANFKTCCDEFNLDYDLVNQCLEGVEGNSLQHKYALVTSSLVPKLVYIPWIIINKVFSQSNQDKAMAYLKGLVCSYFKKPPPQCY